MQVSIETINGKPCTVIKKPFDAQWVKEQLGMGMPVVFELEGIDDYRVLKEWNGNLNLYYASDGDIFFDENIYLTITILPALPKYPTKKDEGLLHEYMAHGLYPYITDGGCEGRLISYDNVFAACWRFVSDDGMDFDRKQADNFYILHAEDMNGEQHEIAIIDNAANGKE